VSAIPASASVVDYGTPEVICLFLNRAGLAFKVK